MKMHEGELDIAFSQIKKLLLTQCPAVSNLIIYPKNYGGTVNNVYRLGEKLYLRLPRMSSSTEIQREASVLNIIQPFVSIKLPLPVFIGQPTDDYPSIWGIYEWIEGETVDQLSNEEQICLAQELVHFIKEIRHIPIQENAPKAGRKPLKELDQKTRDCINASIPYLDYPDEAEKLKEIWSKSLRAAPWDGSCVYIHADLLPTNLLMEAGKLKAILDFGAFGIGDPAFDLIPAWAVFGPAGREVFKRLMNPNEDEWLRAKAYAMHQALLIIPYYAKSFPSFTAMALRTLNQIIIDDEKNYFA